MQELIAFIVRGIVDSPESVSIEPITSADRTVYRVHVAEGDIGHVIGRGGKTISAIRDIIKAAAIKQNAYIDVEIAEK